MGLPGFSRRLQAVAADPGAAAWDLHAEAKRQAAAGRDVILLSVGDPDFDTPGFIVDAAVDALRNGRTHYPAVAGEPALRAAIAQYHAERSDRTVDPGQIQVFAGAQNALFSVFQALLDDGDEVVLLEPHYATYPSAVLAAGGRPISIPSRSEDGFLPPLDALLTRIGPRTRAVLINSPGNPSGAVIPSDYLQALAEDAARRGYWLLSDEVYADLRFDGGYASLFDHVTPRAHYAVIGSLSKRLAMSGWRLGWCLGPRDLIRALTVLATAQLFGSPPFIQDAATLALQQAPEEVARMRDHYAARARCVAAALADAPNLRVGTPAGGMFMLLDVAATGLDGLAFARRLLDEHGVSLIPGIAFGSSMTSMLRLSLVQSEPRLIEACARIRRLAERCVLDGAAGSVSS